MPNISLSGRSDLLAYFDKCISGNDEAIDLREEFDDRTKIWFGKYAGKGLHEIPISYLRYLWKEGYSEKEKHNTKEGRLARYIKKSLG